MPFLIFAIPGILCFIWGVVKGYKNYKSTN